jgi:DNA processing protein
MKSKNAIQIITKTNNLYPKLLKEIPDAPENLYIQGELPNPQSPAIAIVGTRKATAFGKNLARTIARKLGELKITIVSGLAMGIDTAAHEGALESKARTIAILANGVDFIYPRQNENLAKNIIINKGAIISEYKPGTPPLPYQFLKRNRLISGMCQATIVIEASLSSGALTTARLAAEQGREVFVFPGPINHPNYHGSHQLIRDGARLVSSIEDVLEDLGLELPQFSKKNLTQHIQDPNQKLIFRILKEAGKPVEIDKIIEVTNLEAPIVNQAITILICNNFIKEEEGGYTIN